MPRIMIEVSSEWVQRFHDVLPSAIATLQGFENQMEVSIVSGEIEAAHLLESLLSQIRDLRRSLESTRVMF